MQQASQFVKFFLKHSSHEYAKGEIILSSDAPSLMVCYLTQGFVRAYSLSPTGEQKIYIFYQPGDIFPVVWTFNNENKHLSYEAIDDAIVYKVRQDEFMEYIKNKPDLLFEIIHRIVDRHSMYVDRVENLDYTNGNARLIATLLWLGKRFGKKEENGILVQIPLTHDDIANAIAMTRETASRELECLQKKGLIRKYNRLLFLADIKGLEKELEFFS